LALITVTLKAVSLVKATAPTPGAKPTCITSFFSFIYSIGLPKVKNVLTVLVLMEAVRGYTSEDLVQQKLISAKLMIIILLMLEEQFVLS